MSNQTTVSDLFRRAMEIRKSNPNGSFKDVKEQLVSEFDGKPFPSPAFLTIPEYDNIAPEEDWTAGFADCFARHSNRKLGGNRAGNYHQSRTGRKLSEGIGQRRRARKRMAQPSSKASPKKKRKICKNGCRKI